MTKIFIKDLNILLPPPLSLWAFAGFNLYNKAIRSIIYIFFFNKKSAEPNWPNFSD